MRILRKWRNLYLVGFMGTGKTKQAKLLVPHLQRKVFDMDQRIVELYGGMPIVEVFKEFGEPHFRQTETSVVLETIKLENQIVSCGGGTFCQPAPNPNAELMLEHGVVVWLDLSFDLIRERLKKKTDRPLWSEDDVEKNRRLLEERIPLYAKADHRISIVDELPPPVITERILEAVN